MIDHNQPGLRAFISYSHHDREAAANVSAALAELGITTFMAHEDIQVSEKWQKRIVEELNKTDLFIPLLSSNFRNSEWTSQEVGFAMSRPDFPIIPLALDDTVPYGFINHLQSECINGKDRPSPDLFVRPLVEALPRKTFPVLIGRMRSAGSFRDAEKIVGRIAPFYAVLTAEETEAFAKAAIENGQVWDANQCKKRYLPDFLKEKGGRIDTNLGRILSYQINKGQQHPEALNIKSEDRGSLVRLFRRIRGFFQIKDRT